MVCTDKTAAAPDDHPPGHWPRGTLVNTQEHRNGVPGQQAPTCGGPGLNAGNPGEESD